MNKIKKYITVVLIVSVILSSNVNAIGSVQIVRQDGSEVTIGGILRDVYNKGKDWVKTNVLGQKTAAEEAVAVIERQDFSTGTNEKPETLRPTAAGVAAAEKFAKPTTQGETSSNNEEYSDGGRVDTQTGLGASAEADLGPAYFRNGEYCGEQACSSVGATANSGNSDGTNSKESLSPVQKSEIAKSAGKKAEKQARESGATPDEAKKAGEEAGKEAVAKAEEQQGGGKVAENGKVSYRKDCIAGLAVGKKNGVIKDGSEKRYAFVTAGKLSSESKDGKDETSEKSKVYRVGMQSPVDKPNYFIDIAVNSKENRKFEDEKEIYFCCQVSKKDPKTKKTVCAKADPDRKSDKTGDIVKKEISA
jgi:hypothetical protein